MLIAPTQTERSCIAYLLILLIVCHAKRFYALPVNLNEMDDIYAAIIKQPALEKNVIKNKK